MHDVIFLLYHTVICSLRKLNAIVPVHNRSRVTNSSLMIRDPRLVSQAGYADVYFVTLEIILQKTFGTHSINNEIFKKCISSSSYINCTFYDYRDLNH